MSDQPNTKSTHELAAELYRELFEIEVLARSKNLPLDIDMLEVKFGILAKDAGELVERLKPVSATGGTADAIEPNKGTAL